MEENILVRVGADISNLTRGMSEGAKSVQNFGQSVQRIERMASGMSSVGATIGATFGAVSAATTTALVGMVKTTVDFDTALRRAGAIAGATSGELEEMRAAALDLGATTTKSASEVATAMTEMAAKGYDANQIIAAMPGIIAAAEASGEDLALTADTVSSALNAFGLEAGEASRVADVLAQTANQSAAGIQDMSYSFKYAAPVVSSLGVSLEELAAATGIMADVGIRGEQAGTTLRGGLVQLLKPAEQTAKMMESMGIQVTDANGKFIGLAGVIREFQESMKGMTDTQKLATLSQIVGTEAASGFLALMKAGPSEIEKMTKALENSGGASKEAAEQMMGGIGGALEELSGAFETLSILIGSQLAPYIQSFATWLSGLIQRFNEASPAVQKFVAIGLALTAGLTGLIAVLGAVAAGIGFMLTGIMPLISAIAQAGGVTAILSSALAFLTNPITLTIAGITALIAVFVALYSKVDWFRNAVNTVWEGIKTAWNAAITFLRDITISIMSEIIAFFSDRLSGIKELWDRNGKDIMTAVNNYWRLIAGNIQMYMNIIKGIFQIIWPILSNIVKVVWNGMRFTIGSVLDIIIGLIDAGLSLLRGDWKGAWDAIKGIAEDIWRNIETFFKNVDLFEIGKDIINGLINGIGSMFGAVKKRISELANMIPSWAKKILGIHSPSRVLRDEVGRWIPAGLIDGINGMKSDVIKSARKLTEWATPDIPSVSLAYSTPNGVYGSLSKAVNGTVNVDSRDEILAAAIDRLERSLDGMTIVMDGERVGHLVRGYVNEGNAVDATIRRYFG